MPAIVSSIYILVPIVRAVPIRFCLVRINGIGIFKQKPNCSGSEAGELLA